MQVLKVQPTTLTRISAAYWSGGLQQFSNHARHHAGERTGQPGRRAFPDSRCRRASPCCIVASPDYSQLRTNYLKAQDAMRWHKKHMRAPRILYEHKAIAEQELEQAQSAEVQAGGDLVIGAGCVESDGRHRSRCAGEGSAVV